MGEAGEAVVAMSAVECQSRLQALRDRAAMARAESRPAQEAYRNNPSSFEAKAAVELSLQRSARIIADSVQAERALRRGPCQGVP